LQTAKSDAALLRRTRRQARLDALKEAGLSPAAIEALLADQQGERDTEEVQLIGTAPLD
jgi:hypothetical protein